MKLIQQVLEDGEIIPRLAQSKYDPHSIEGRTSEAAAQKVGRYELIFISATRIRELNKGVAPLIKKVHGNRVTALQEIQEGLIDGDEYFLKATEPVKRQRS